VAWEAGGVKRTPSKANSGIRPAIGCGQPAGIFCQLAGTREPPTPIRYPSHSNLNALSRNERKSQ
jgi:hypothetical protein